MDNNNTALILAQIHEVNNDIIEMLQRYEEEYAQSLVAQSKMYKP